MPGLVLSNQIIANSFSPLNISGCEAWFRSDLGITFTSGTVHGWADQSGNGNNTVASSPGPTYIDSDSDFGGKPSLYWQLVSPQPQQLYNYTFTISQPNTVYLVCLNTSTGGSFYDGIQDGTEQQIGCDGVHVNMYANTEVVSGVSVSNASAICGVFNGASSFLYINNSSSPALSNVNPGNSGQDGIQLCQASGGIVKIAEAIIYSSNHSSTQVSQVFRYFASRYGISST